jgi:hypothetical protein
MPVTNSTKKRNNTFAALVRKPRPIEAKYTVTAKKVNIELPRSLLKYWKLPCGKNVNANQEAKLFWIPINGTVQLLGKAPALSIPALVLDEGEFEAQEVSTNSTVV